MSYATGITLDLEGEGRMVKLRWNTIGYTGDHDQSVRKEYAFKNSDSGN